jgi:hypothetical protein
MLKDSDGEKTGKENSASNPTQTMYQIKLQVHPTTNVLPKYDPKLMGKEKYKLGTWGYF